MQKQSKKEPQYRENKRAFDNVMMWLRRMVRAKLGPVGAVNPERCGGSGATESNGAKPSPVDFKCDVFLVIKAKLPRGIRMVDFHKAYTCYDSDVDIDRELNAQRWLGNRRHSVEQRLGEEFRNRKIYPVSGKGYFYAPRKSRPA